MPHADVNGQRIWFEDTGGDGPTVILAQSFSSSDSAADRLDLLDHLGIDRAVVGGMSGAHAAHLTNPGPVNAALRAFLSDPAA